MAETSARLLLLLSLLQSRRAWPGPELAERLEVSPRTLRRDVDRLRQLGYPVRGTKGPGAAYRLDAGTKLPPLVFDDDQAIAVAVALQTAPTTVMGLGEAAARALATVRQVMPTRLHHRVDAVQVTSISNDWDMDPPQVDPEVLLAVATAVHGHELLRFDYAPDASDEGGPATARSRRVEPHHLVVWAGRWYLVAWDLERQAWQTFRVDRLTPRDRSGIHFTPRELPGPDVTTFVTHQSDRGETLDHWPCRGEAILDVAAAVVARWAPGGAIVEELAPTRCRVTLGAWSWVGLAALLGTFEADIEVLGPPELRAACAELAERYAAASTDRRPG